LGTLAAPDMQRPSPDDSRKKLAVRLYSKCELHIRPMWADVAHSHDPEGGAVENARHNPNTA